MLTLLTQYYDNLGLVLALAQSFKSVDHTFDVSIYYFLFLFLFLTQVRIHFEVGAKGIQFSF